MGISTLKLVAVGLLILVLAEGSAIALDPSPGATGAEPVMLTGPSCLAKLRAIVAGRGIDGADVPPLLVSGGEIVWQKLNEDVDDLGVRHSFYRQQLVPGADLASRLDKQQMDKGLELLGGEIGIHTALDEPQAIAGAQHREIRSLAEPVIVERPMLSRGLRKL